MKKHALLKGLIAISLIFSADLMAGKSKKYSGKPKTTVSRKMRHHYEEKALVPAAPPPPSLALIVTGTKDGDEKKNDKKSKGVLSLAKGAKNFLQAGASTLKNVAMGQPLSDQVLDLGLKGLKSVALGKPSSFVSSEMRLLQSVVLRSVPLDQKAKAIGGQRESYKGVSLLAQMRGEELEKELQTKAGGTRERLEAWQLIQENSENPERRAFLEEVVHAVVAREERLAEQQKVWAAQRAQQTWVAVQFASSGKRHQKLLEEIRKANGKPPEKDKGSSWTFSLNPLNYFWYK